MIFSVTSSIFYKKIEEFTQVRKIQKTFNDGPIINTQIWNHDTIVSPNMMYIILEKDLEINFKYFKDNLIVCAGNYDNGQCPPVFGCDLIICPQLTDLSALVNIIFTIQNQFRSWKNTVNDIYLTTNSFFEVFKASRELFNMDFFLMTTDYDILAVSEYFYGRKKNTRTNAQIFLRNIKNDEDHEFSEHFHDTQLYEINTEDALYKIYAYNIFDHNTHKATLLFKTSAKEYNSGDIQLMSYMGHTCMEHYAKCFSMQTHTIVEDRLVDALRKTAGNQNLPPDEFTDILNAHDWFHYHQYQIYIFTFLEQKRVGFSSKYACIQIEHFLPVSIAFPMEDYIYCVQNITLGGQTNTKNDLPYFLRDNLCKVGISNIFHGMNNSSVYFKQAHMAYLIGSAKEPTFWYYRFSAFAFDYLLYQCRKEYPTDQICHPALRQLMEHDTQKHTDYYHTLRLFLRNNMNASKTAGDLYIHRSTFLQRFAQIKKITHIDLEDETEKIYLQLSFLLTEKSPQ